MQSVLFLCTGNYYRSRFAEILFDHLAKHRKMNWRATSRGLKIGWPGNVGAMSPHTVKRLAELQIDATDRQRMPMICRECDLAEANLVVALKEAEHRSMMTAQFPAWAERIEYWHVHDVEDAHPDVALAEIEQLVLDLIGRLPAKRS